MTTKISIIGSGAMGTAVAKVMYDSGYQDITIFGIDNAELADLENGKNLKYFPEDTKIPKFKTTTNISEAVKGSKYVIMAVPSHFMDSALKNVLENLDTEVIIISVSKGFYPGTDYSLHEGISEATKDNNKVKDVISLIGPSHAEEIVKEIPTIVSLVGNDHKILNETQVIFSNNYFRTYVQTDVKGAEVGAAYKNVLAIASGVANGLGYGINTIAGLLTRGMAEMMRFNELMGGKPETIMGLTGLGDLIVTATSNLSRNFTFGTKLAQEGKSALETKITVEGLYALNVIHKIAAKNNLELPIVDALYKIVGGEDAHIIVKSLWARGLKDE